MTYQITEADIQNFVSWAAAHQIKNEDADTTGDTHHNNQTVYEYMNRWGAPWTRENLDKALVQLRPYLKFYESSAQAAHGQFSNQLGESDRNTIDAWLRTQGRLVTEGDDGLRNKMNVVKWVQEKGMAINSHNLSLALSNIVNNGHLGHAPLVWKKVEQKKKEREVSNAEIATWRSRAEGACVTTPSGLVLRTKTEQIQQIVVNGAGGKIDWKATAQARELAASRGGKN